MAHVTQLGYLGIGVSDIEAWEKFATQTLGLQVGERHAEPARQIANSLREAGFRVDADTSAEKTGHKIRTHLWQQKVPFIGVVGDRELEQGGLAVRHRQDGDLGTMTASAFGELLDRMTKERR